MAIYEGIDSETREFAFDPTPEADNAVFYDELVGTDEMSELDENFDLHAETNGHSEDGTPMTGVNLIDFVIGMIHGTKTLSKVREKLKELLKMGGHTRFGNLVPKVVEQPVIETPVETPEHRGQAMWRSHAEFMRTGGKDGGPPNMEEVRARKADPE